MKQYNMLKKKYKNKNNYNRVGISLKQPPVKQ